MTQCVGRGDCLQQQFETSGREYYTRSFVYSCTFKCKPVKCPQCKTGRYPLWYFGCHGGMCRDCNMTRLFPLHTNQKI